MANHRLNIVPRLYCTVRIALVHRHGRNVQGHVGIDTSRDVRGYLRVVVPTSGLVFGFVAAILTIVLPFYVERWGVPLITALFGMLFWGEIFGAVIAVFLCIFLPSRSLVKAIWAIVASTFAYLVAWYTTVYSSMFGGMMKPHEPSSGTLENTSVFAFLIGGTVGAFALLFPLFLVFSRTRTARRAFLDSSIWSVAGGVLGAIGWALGPSLGKVAASMLGYHGTSNPGELSDQAYYDSIFLVWQTGMGLVLGLLFSREAVLGTLPNLQLPPSKRPTTAVVCFMALVLLYFGFRFVPEDYRSARSRQEWSKHIAETPSREGLRKVPTRPVEEMLFLQPIANYVPSRTVSGETNSILDETGRRKTPEAIMYSVLYTNPDVPDQVGGYVRIRVEEYPNAAWAKFQIAEQGFGKRNTELKFGNKVEGNTEYQRNGEGYYLWSSGDFLVVLELHDVNPDPLLQAYLQKYPSSL